MEPEVVNATARPLDVYDPEGREITLHLPTSALIIDATPRWVTLPERSLAGAHVPRYGLAYELTVVDHDGTPVPLPEPHDDTLYVVGEGAAIAHGRPDFVISGPPVLDGDLVIGCKGLGLPGHPVAAFPEPRRFDELAELALLIEWPEHHPWWLSKPSEMARMLFERDLISREEMELAERSFGDAWSADPS